MLRPFALVLCALVVVLAAADLISRGLPATNVALSGQLCRFLYVCREGVERDQAFGLLAQPRIAPQAVDILQTTLNRNPGSPHRWEDLGDALLVTGDRDRARQCYERALQLGPNIPAVQWRAANAYVRFGDIPKSMVYMSQILREVSLYDAGVFSYFDSLRLDMGHLLGQGIPEDSRAAEAYFRHLLQTGKASDAQQTWVWMVNRSLANETLARDYANTLLRGRQYLLAAEVWNVYMKGPSAGPAEGDLVFNGGFEKPLGDTHLDWTVHPTDQVEATRDRTLHRSGEWSLRVKFDATENLNYRGPSHAVLVAPGQYRFTAYVRCEGITTDQGLRFRISDVESPARLDIKTASLTGTSDWQAVQLDFATPAQTHAIEIQLIRDLSKKFDNQIKGAAWVDDVSVTPLKPRSPANISKTLAPRPSPESRQMSVSSAGYTN